MRPVPKRDPKQPRGKPGRKFKIGDKQRAEIIAILTVGASRQDAADYIGLNYKNLYNYWHRFPDFDEEMRQAEAKGKIHHLNKLAKSEDWRASAFMLERKWWQEFGKKDKVQNEHSGKDGKGLTIEVVYKKPAPPKPDDADDDDADDTDPIA